MRRKLTPALFNLHHKGKLPRHFKIVAFSRRDYTDEMYRGYLKEEVLPAHPNISRKDFSGFLKLFTYARGEFENQKSYKLLSQTLCRIDSKWGVCTNKLFYVAASPEMYRTVFSHLSFSGLTEPCGPEEGWTRVIVEKPFGKDFATAQKLDELLGKLFREVQIYRIDHYLAKEILQNILTFRFSNNLLEKNWSNESIERIDIRLWENIGVEKRGAFYDSIGALRDVGQNHLLQMLALVTMDLPANFDPAGVRTARSELLRTLKIPTLAEVKKNTFRAQHEEYRAIKGVDPKSETETYFKIRTQLISPRWKGVPITAESGKRMGGQKKEITVTFRHPRPCLCLGASHHQNKVLFALEPEERITIQFWSKKPGLGLEMEERKFEFLLREGGAKTQYVEEYEKLLIDCIAGDQALFISTDEVQGMWRFIDPIVRAWGKNAVPLKRYAPDTSDISEEAKLQEKEKITKTKKELGIVGLGKMGMNIALRLQGLGWRIMATDLDSAKQDEARFRGLEGADSLEDLSKKLRSPRILWLMVPALAKATAGRPAISPVNEVIFGTDGLVKFLKQGDIIIDGGNSFFEDSMRRAKKLRGKGISFLDAGVSGGPHGAREGLSIMVGGEKKIYEKVKHLFEDLAAPQGLGYVGDYGAGHFVKMVHNGIEYGMMQSLAEGFAVMKKSKFKFNLAQIAGIYNHGSVVSSRLTWWLERAFEELGENLPSVSGKVSHTGEGEWTVKTARKLKVPVKVIQDALSFRRQSQKNPSYAGKILSALRNQFGGHSVK